MAEIRRGYVLGRLEKWRNGLVDSFTRLWAKEIEEGRKDGDGSSLRTGG
jgi:hypothetical protein